MYAISLSHTHMRARTYTNSEPDGVQRLSDVHPRERADDGAAARRRRLVPVRRPRDKGSAPPPSARPSRAEASVGEARLRAQRRRRSWRGPQRESLGGCLYRSGPYARLAELLTCITRRGWRPPVSVRSVSRRPPVSVRSGQQPGAPGGHVGRAGKDGKAEREPSQSCGADHVGGPLSPVTAADAARQARARWSRISPRSATGRRLSPPPPLLRRRCAADP